MQKLNRILSNLKKPIAILAGAGISMDPPAGLPSAKGLLDKVLLQKHSKSLRPDEIKHLVDRSTEYQTRPGEFLRFEIAMADIDFNVRASILSELQFGTPNPNHYALAQLINQGHVVITTNFDRQIETAYQHLYGQYCSVAHRDVDFVNPPSPASSKMLWKIHGCLKDADDIGIAFTTILSKSSSRMRWFENILASFDIIIFGYSGSDDLDLISSLSRTISKKYLLWIDHSISGKIEYITPSLWLARSNAKMHLDCIGVTRVMFSCHNASRATRQNDNTMILKGPTRLVLDSVLLWAGIQNTVPADFAHVAQGYRFQQIEEVDEFVSAKNSLALLEHRRGAKINTIIDRVERQLINVGLKGSPSHQLDLLVQLYNSKKSRNILKSCLSNSKSIWNAIAKMNQLAFLTKLDSLEKMFTERERPLALRLRGCLLHESAPNVAQNFFEQSIKAAREIGDPFMEVSTLNTYNQILYPSHFPAFWHNQQGFPHVNRLNELTSSTGYFPMIMQNNLNRNIDYANKLQVLSLSYLEDHGIVGPEEVFWDTWDMRRMAIDLGDVNGEMLATYVLAEISLAMAIQYKKVLMFSPWIEWQRLYLLAEALNTLDTFGERLSYIASLPAPNGVFSRDEIKASMFS